MFLFFIHTPASKCSYFVLNLSSFFPSRIDFTGVVVFECMIFFQENTIIINKAFNTFVFKSC